MDALAMEVLAKEEELGMNEDERGGGRWRMHRTTRRACVSLDASNGGQFEKFELFEPLNGGGAFAANGEDVLPIVD